MNTPGRLKTAAPIASSVASPISGTMPRAAPRALPPGEPVPVALSAAILAVRAGEPVVAVVPSQRPNEESLPSGPFHPR
ncbi:MAG: hypothetical protein J2P50_19280, partial [Hyphomicrobiaceae bacterium]|nr:hypothetical protein [Hyphomicrobiaceae bacterium]